MASAENREALEAWFEAHLPRIQKYVGRRLRGRVRDLESASDIVQSAVREVLAQWARDGSASTQGLTGRIYRQSVRKLVDKHRHHTADKRWPAGSLLRGSRCTGIPSADLEPLETIVLREDSDRLERALERLPVHYRSVVRWAYDEGLPHAEIGRRLGRSEEASKMLLMRALVKLGEALAP